MISNFTATPYNQGVLLRWSAGQGVVDTSGELILYSDDRTFTNSAHWTTSLASYPLPSFSVSGGKLNFGSGAGPTFVIGYQWGGLPPANIGDGSAYAFHTGRMYKITYTYTGTVGGFRFQIGSINKVVGTLEVGTDKTLTFICPGEGTSLMIVALALSASGTLDNVSIVEVYGTTNDQCDITIQYSTDDVANVVPNTPPYVVRNLRQTQLTNHSLWHGDLVNGTPYTYSLFVRYLDSGQWEGPILTHPVTPLATLSTPLTSVSGSFSKLGVNTKLSSVQDSMTEIVVWMPDTQEARKTELEDIIKQIAPAHVRVNVVYEPYYIAHTTTTQFTSGSYSSNVYTITEGTIKNKVPTIDKSFSGKFAIFGGV